MAVTTESGPFRALRYGDEKHEDHDKQGPTSIVTVKKFVSEMSELNKLLKKLHKDVVTSASEKDVVDVLKFLFQDHEDLDNIVNEMFHVGGAMFATAVQLIVARTLVQDPERYAELVEASETGSDAVFKKNADIESMRDFIVSSVLGRQHQRSKQPTRKYLLKQFDSPTKRADVKASRMPSSAFSSHSSQSSSDEERENPKRTTNENRGKSKPKRFRQGLELLVHDEEDVPTTSKTTIKKTPKKGKDKKNK